MQEIKMIYVTEKGERFEGNISRQELLAKMQEFKTAYPANNQISSKMLELLPYIETINIDKRRARDTPFISGKLKPEFFLDIPSNHKKIWKCLDEYGKSLKDKK